MADPQELAALQRRRKMAEALLAQGMDSSPVNHPLQAVARVVQAYMGGKQAEEADKGMADYDRGMQQDRARALGEYMAKMQGQPGISPLTANDDEGFAMPSSPGVAPDPKGAMGSLLSARDPALQQHGMSMMLAQNKQDDFTLKPGESRFSGGKVVASLPSEAPRAPTPKMGDTRTIHHRNKDEQQEWDGSKWVALAERPWQPPQGDGVKPGTYDADRGVLVDTRTGQAKPVMGPDGPLGAKPPKPSEAYLKQQAGVENVRGAIADYREALKGYTPAQLVQPEARARMGTVYNNMLLQAKEAYNLGVLNGPDYAILQAVVTDPMSLKGAMSRGSLDDQAKKLDSLMEKIGKGSAKAHGQGGAAPASGGFKYLGPG